ncbi:MAG: SUF system NifU family Fe-S cluster assembly protein [Chloroflexi bacterium]|nr:SUF system NifU family Fe-S cluster assembly protein [Chloroflexota bacterium]
MDDYYREIILEHYKRPSYRGQIPGATITHEEDNPLCGDRIRIELLVEAGVVKDARFNGQGCAISQASADMLMEELRGKTLDEARQLDKQFVLDMLGIPLTPARLKCALLSLKVLKVGVYGAQAWAADEDDD